MKKKKLLLSICSILIITAISFYPSLYNDFNNWDDDKYITNNLIIQNLSLENIKTIFTSFHCGLYQPLVLLSYSIEYHFFKLNPTVYHITNFILHLLNCLFVFWLIFTLSNNNLISFITAILFGIHPLKVESVAWVTERKDLLFSLFFLISLIAYIYYRKKQARSYYYISFFLFILAVLSKIMAITLPCILILYDYLFYKKITWNNIKEKLPFFLITFLLVITNIFVLYSSMFASKNLSFSIINNMFIVSHVFLLYIYKLILPIKLSLIYPYPANLNTQLPVSYIVSLPLALILFAFIVLINRYSRHIAFGSLFFLITITPVLQILPITCTSLIYDRFTYIPSIGISYIIGHGFNYLYFKQWRYSKILKIFLIIFLACIIIIFSFLTWQRCYVWKDSITLWNNVLHTYPDMSVAYNNRGHAYLLKGEKDKAISDFTKLITLFPGMAEAYYNRACVYDLKGERNKAISDFTEALKINPYFGEAYYNRGNAYYKEGKYIEAIYDFTEALYYCQDRIKIYYSRGLAYMSLKYYERTIEDFTKVLSIKPDYLETYHIRGDAYYHKGDFKNAISDFTKALLINPDSDIIYNKRGKAYYSIDDYNSALADFNSALNFNPDLPEAYQNRAYIYFIRKDYEKAWKDIKLMKSRGYEINPDFLESLKKENILNK